jgi:hypothetical protein
VKRGYIEGRQRQCRNGQEVEASKEVTQKQAEEQKETAKVTDRCAANSRWVLCFALLPNKLVTSFYLLLYKL